jgi:hypothetical protein
MESNSSHQKFVMDSNSSHQKFANECFKIVKDTPEDLIIREKINCLIDKQPEMIHLGKFFISEKLRLFKFTKIYVLEKLLCPPLHNYNRHLITNCEPYLILSFPEGISYWFMQ